MASQYRDKRKETWVPGCIWLIVAMWFVGTVLLDSVVITNDTRHQLLQGTVGEYDNWKPALYSWMLGIANNLWEGHAVGLLYVVQLLAMGMAVGGIAHYYSREHKLYGLLVLALPLFFTTKVMLVSTVGNDAMAAACYLLFIAGILWSKRVAMSRKSIFLWAGCWLVLMVGLAMRHNAAPAVFVLLVWACLKAGVKGWFRILGMALVLLGSMLAANYAIAYHLLGCKPSYPLKTALADDLVNLSILDGKWSSTCLDFAKEELPPPHEIHMLAADVANGGIPINPYASIKDPAEAKEVYYALLDGWKEEVEKYPARWLMLKGFWFHQFLLEGRCAPWFCSLVRDKYPHVKISMESESRRWRSWINREFVGMSLIPLSCYALLAVALVKRLRRKLQLSEEMLDALFFMGVALTYTLTFLLLVMSATELRFYIVRASLTCVALFLFVLSWWIQKKGAAEKGLTALPPEPRGGGWLPGRDR